jgi:hypothetical protein
MVHSSEILTGASFIPVGKRAELYIGLPLDHFFFFLRKTVRNLGFPRK